MAKHSVREKQYTSATSVNPISPTKIHDFPMLTSDQRQHMIAEAAYYLAEHRGFKGGDPAQDWLQAEMEIDKKLKGVPH